MTDHTPSKQILLEKFLTRVLGNAAMLSRVILALSQHASQRHAQLSLLSDDGESAMMSAGEDDLLALFDDDEFALEVLCFLQRAERKDPDHERGIPDCPVKVIVPGRVIQCLREHPVCGHCFRFGAQWFCSHPFKRLIALRYSATGYAS